VAVDMFAQTVGIRPRQKSSALRICFCPQCSVSLAMGPPPEGALNIAGWNMIRELGGGGSCPESGGLGHSARGRRFAAGGGGRPPPACSQRWRLFRILGGTLFVPPSIPSSTPELVSVTAARRTDSPATATPAETVFPSESQLTTGRALHPQAAGVRRNRLR